MKDEVFGNFQRNAAASGSPYSVGRKRLGANAFGAAIVLQVHRAVHRIRRAGALALERNRIRR